MTDKNVEPLLLPKKAIARIGKKQAVVKTITYVVRFAQNLKMKNK